MRRAAALQGPELEYWWRRMEETAPKWTQLRDTCRAAGVEVMYTVIQSLTSDGRDQSLDYKISGFHVPPGSFDAQAGPVMTESCRCSTFCFQSCRRLLICMAVPQVFACVKPGPDDIVIPKTSSSVFCSTNVDYILRRCMPGASQHSMSAEHQHVLLLLLRKCAIAVRVSDAAVGSLGVRYLILAGCVTDQCVESAVRDACDKHYYVTLVTGEHDSAVSDLGCLCAYVFVSDCFAIYAMMGRPSVMVWCRCLCDLHSGAP